jgi:murein tripeptide amidase MpaA
MNPNLDNLVKIGKLKAEPFAETEFRGLVNSAEKRLADAANSSLSPESRFDLAYNAAHAYALAALRVHGYRSENRAIVFQALQHTVGMETAKWRVLSKCHDARNLAEYEGHTDVDLRLLDDLLKIAGELQSAVLALR